MTRNSFNGIWAWRNPRKDFYSMTVWENAIKSLKTTRSDPTWRLIAGILVGIVIFAFASAEGDMGTFSITMLSGLLRAMLLFLVAAGLSLIFGLMDILNFAQGMYFMTGAYVAYDISHPRAGFITFGESIGDPTLRFAVGVVIAIIVGGALGYLLERVLLRPLYSRPLFQLVLTFGVSIVMLEAIKAIWGTTPFTWQERISIQESQFFVFGQQFSAYRLFVILMGFLLIILVSMLLRRTRIGIIIRAGVQDPEMVNALGINVRAVFTLVFTLGCALAAFGGAVAAPFLGATISMGNTYLLAAIAVIVFGGLGSYEGTAVASVLVGLGWATMEQFSVRPQIGSVWASITPMLMLAVILLIRPSGLFGEDR
jgi:branched-chain amino acid transport system permease protein